ncbi:head GIN domain-containing protein [Pareuzebyella sediminis]|uniref:head GIN domain-containing protein n=1 Tax=Pareuzebyella sediminis TaxID=2607998 RepID=UPI0011EC6AD2|nr:head GIN domain-containing protein [Pareuzebyella sediminis]
MKNTTLILSLGILIVTSCSAQWGKKIKGNGNLVTIKRSVANYEGVAVSGWFDVDLVEGREGNLSLEGEENLLEYIVTEVKNGSLNIRVKKGANLKPSSWNQGIRITVPVEDIENISMSGSGDIVGKTTLKASKFQTAMSGSGDITLHVMANTMTATMSGSGDMNLAGKVKDFEASVSGSGDIKAYDLTADNVQATISGSADIKVTAKEMLKARVSGSGDISYRGNPKKVDTKTSGSGDISKG